MSHSKHKSIQPIAPKETHFVQIRQTVLHKTATTTKSAKNFDNHLKSTQTQTMFTKSITRIQAKQKLESTESNIIIHSQYEFRFRNISKYIRRLWNNLILSTKILHGNVIVGTALNQTLQKEMKMHHRKKLERELKSNQTNARNIQRSDQ